MEIIMNRKPTIEDTTFGNLEINGEFFCYTLEDAVREVVGKPVSEWKIKGRTAIPVGRYQITLESSPRFGPETITVNDVPGFSFIRMHSGNSHESTEGCPIVGDQINEKTRRIGGGLLRGVLTKLKEKIRYALKQKEEVWLTIESAS